MLWILLLLLLLLLLWVGAGILVWHRGSGSVGTDLRRSVDRRVASVGSEVAVTLRMIPPALLAEVNDHDVVLVIDHSSSMGAGPGSPLREAVRAAERFVRRCPDQIQIGVVVFDHLAELLCPITNDHQKVLKALATIGPGGATAIDKALVCSRAALDDGRPEIETTVILLSDGGSDRSAAEQAADELRQHPSEPGVICIGFGAGVDEGLLRAVAGSPDRYCHVARTEELESLFGFLAAVVSGQMAISGLVEEPARAPHPYTLGSTGELYPLGVDSGETTRVIWSVPLLDLRSVSLGYRLTPECPGWHAVAAAGGTVTWRMPDGSSRQSGAPEGPRVLVLPELLRWAWPILNPLFWLLLQRFVCRRPEAEEPEQQAEEPAGLPQPSLPAPLPEPQERPYQATVRPSLVVGLGEVGEWVLCRLRDRWIDRVPDPGDVTLLSITVTHPANWAEIGIAGSEHDSCERVSLDQDLRPYVESLRSAGAPPTRAWVPWQEWLGQATPLTTVRTLGGDRRKARLALLQSPEAVEVRLESAVASILQQDGLVILVGDAADAECSGLLPEVAHICAAAGGSCTAVLTSSAAGRPEPSSGTVALAQELERLVRMRGDAVLSDRHDPAVAAERLFDRVVVLPTPGAAPERASSPAAELIWSVLAYQDVLRRLPVARVEDDKAVCCTATVDAVALPGHHLWRWVRERTLSQAINGQWLGLEVDDDGEGFVLPEVAADLVDDAVKAFWHPRGSARPQSRLLACAAAILHRGEKGRGEGGAANPVALLLGQLPVERAYHEQSRLHRHECRAFAAFCEQWCHDLLVAEQQRGRWGLPLLVSASLHIEQGLRTVQERIGQMSGNQDFRRLTNLAVDVYTDLERIFSGIRTAAGPWIAAICGEQAALCVTGVSHHERPLAFDIEAARAESDRRLRLPDQAIRRLVEEQFATWYAGHGQALPEQLCFRVASDAESHRFSLRLRLAEEELGSGAEVAAALRSFLDRYCNVVLSWPLHRAIPARDLPGSGEVFRIGKHSPRLFPGAPDAADERDPFLAAAISLRETAITDALGVSGLRAAAPPYAWPEEANAMRIASKVRHQRQREPRPFSPAVVHLLRDPVALHAFLADLAQERVTRAGSEVLLERNGREYLIGAASDGLSPLAALGNLERIARQVVAMRVSTDGETIAERSDGWSATPDAAVEGVEQHPLVMAAIEAPQWAMWRDVVEGVVLDVGNR